MDAKYHHGVYGTGKKIIGRLLGTNTREKRHAECQTATMNELTDAFKKTIEHLEEKLKHSDNDLVRSNHELDRLGNKLRSLG